MEKFSEKYICIYIQSWIENISGNVGGFEKKIDFREKLSFLSTFNFP
jgi:hypothetical protein